MTLLFSEHNRLMRSAACDSLRCTGAKVYNTRDNEWHKHPIVHVLKHTNHGAKHGNACCVTWNSTNTVSKLICFLRMHVTDVTENLSAGLRIILLITRSVILIAFRREKQQKLFFWRQTINKWNSSFYSIQSMISKAPCIAARNESDSVPNDIWTSRNTLRTDDVTDECIYSCEFSVKSSVIIVEFKLNTTQSPILALCVCSAKKYSN